MKSVDEHIAAAGERGSKCLTLSRYLDEIPDSLWDLNQLTSLPASIAELPKLRVLDLTGNRLPVMAEPPTRINRLEHLPLYKNPITELPEDLSAMQKLKFFGASNMKLQRLPASIGALANLDLLGLADNKLTSPRPK